MIENIEQLIEAGGAEVSELTFAFCKVLVKAKTRMELARDGVVVTISGSKILATRLEDSEKAVLAWPVRARG